jgi:hypothetical protein
MIFSKSVIAKVVYFATAVSYHVVLLFTNVGNYRHGGTLLELMAINAAAVLIIAVACKLAPRVGLIERALIGLCAFIPMVSTIWSLLSVFIR